MVDSGYCTLLESSKLLTLILKDSMVLFTIRLFQLLEVVPPACKVFLCSGVVAYAFHYKLSEIDIVYVKDEISLWIYCALFDVYIFKAAVLLFSVPKEVFLCL